MTRFDAQYVPASAMTIFAHPDDAEFGAAGTVARWAAAGCQVTMVVCTSGDVGTHDPQYTAASLAETREREQRAAAETLGAHEVVFLHRLDCQLTPDLELRRALVRTIRAHCPEVVICADPTTWFFGAEYVNHPDHRAAAVAALEAVFPCAEMPLLWPEEGPPHKVHAVYIGWTEAPNTWIDIGDTLHLKLAALKAHASQMGEWDPSPMVRGWAAEDARAGRKHAKKQAKDRGKRGKGGNEEGPADGGPFGRPPRLCYSESFRVMVLQREDAPPES